MASGTFFNKDTIRGKVKRFMYMRHLQAFVPVTQHKKLRTIIYDAFGGPGRYGEDWSDVIVELGSPLIALRVVIEDFIKRKNLKYSFNKLRNVDSVKAECEPFLPKVKKIQEIITMPDLGTDVLLNFSEAYDKNYFELFKNVIIVFTFYGISYKISYDPSGVISVKSSDKAFPIGCNIALAEFKHIFLPECGVSSRYMTFIDPFGFSDIPMSHVQNFVGIRKEVLINFMSGFVNRFKKLEKNKNAVMQLFGFCDDNEEEDDDDNDDDEEDDDGGDDDADEEEHDEEDDEDDNEDSGDDDDDEEEHDDDDDDEEEDDDEDNESLSSSGHDNLVIPDGIDQYYELLERSNETDGVTCCMQFYENQLKKKAKSEMVLTFEVRNPRNIRIYHLIFITNHLKGLVTMKEAMNRGTQSPIRLSLSEYMILRKGILLSLKNIQNNKQLAETIYNEFHGKENVLISRIKKYILIDTPFVFRTKALKILQKEENPRLIKVVNEHNQPPCRRWTFPNKSDWLLTFRMRDA